MYLQIYSKGLLFYIAISALLSSGCINIAEGAGNEHIKPVKSSVGGNDSSSSEPDQGPNNSKSYCVTLNSIKEDNWKDGSFLNPLNPSPRKPEPYGRVCAINSDDRLYQRRAKHLLSYVVANCKDLWFEKDENIGSGTARRNWTSTDFLLDFDDIKNMYEGSNDASTISGTKTINARQTITVGDSTRDTVDVLILPIQEHDDVGADDPLYDYDSGGSFEGNPCPRSGTRPEGCGSDKGYKDDFPIVISLNDTNLTGGEHKFTRELRGEKEESAGAIGSNDYYKKLIFSFTFSNGACK